MLNDYKIKAELTATERVGFHRYTFPRSDSSSILFDIGHKQGESSDVTDAFVKWDGENGVEGYVETNPEYVKFCDPGNRVKMYFAAKLNKTPEKVGTFIDSLFYENKVKIKGKGAGLLLSFKTSEQEIVEMQVGLSYTSIANAKVNLETESAGMTFDMVKKKAEKIWNDKLSRIYVEGERQEDKIKFYTGLYHVLLGRGLASDVNGMYPKNDGTSGQIPLDKDNEPLYNHYNTDGMWCSSWNLVQLLALVYPEFLSEYIQSNIDFYKETGWLHDGVAAGVYTNGVQTNYQGLVIASAYNCGIRDFDISTGYEAALKNEIEYRGRNLGNGKYDLEGFVLSGFIPFEDMILPNGWVFNFGASHTMEYSFTSYAVSQMAKQLGREADYAKLIKQACYWEKSFDKESHFIRPRLPNGSFIADFDTMIAWRGFQEGNAFQYTWFVPHDVAGLIDLVGEELFDARLETMFVEARKSMFGGGENIDSFSGIEKLYNHGNQPCLHNAWLFNFTSKPWLTQKWTRIICNEFYGTEPLHGYGIGQDEDQGMLGAWFVLSSMGLFDLQGHANSNPTFQFGSPLFDKIVIKLNQEYYPGEEIVVKTSNNSKDNIYVQSVKLNEEDIEQCWIDRAELIKGGVLEFEMGNKENFSWGTKILPPSMSNN